MAARGTWWLARPSRFAGLRPGRARMVLGLLALLLLACIVSPRPAPTALGAATNAAHDQTDLALYEKIVAGVAHGENYYVAAADAMRAGGYPLHPFFTMRPPALAMVEALLPPIATVILLYLLVAGVVLVWALRLRAALVRTPPRIAAAILFALSIPVFLEPDLIAFHEIWAALLIALSLGLRRPGRWVEAAAIALMAMLIRETAALYAVVMLVLAAIEGERREAFGWAGALGLFALAMAAHAWGVAGVTGPYDPASPGWSGLLGLGSFVQSIALATGLRLLPTGFAALLAGLSLFGWASWDDKAALRMATTLGGYALLLSLFARADTGYWGLMAAPLFLVGLAFAPDGLRDLTVAALDRRRVRVQRISR